MLNINKNYLFASLFAFSSLFSTNILAQDDADENVEEVIVTGSRIATVDLDGINPVQIITSEDIKDSGVLVVADAIRNSMANTFGSEPEGFGGSVDTSVSLRGLGAQRTLVLVDGKRLAGSPAQAGAVPNLNIIPTAAVERVEILTDGASSVYGGSAAGGVVNVILKDDFEGVNIRGGMTENHLPGGEENNFSIVLGSSGAKSNVVMTYEHQERDAKYWADRPYTGSTDTNTDGDYDLNNVFNVSQGSRTFVVDGSSQYLPLATCTGNDLMYKGGKLYYDSAYAGDASCLFDYSAVGTDDSSRKSDVINTIYKYQFNDRTNLEMRATYSRVEGLSRFAPAVGVYAIEGGNTTVIAPTFLFSGGGTWSPTTCGTVGSSTGDWVAADCSSADSGVDHDGDGWILDPDGDGETYIENPDATPRVTEWYDYELMPDGTVVGLSNTDNTLLAEMDGLGYVRFTANGNRDDDAVANMLDIMATVTHQMSNGWVFDATVQYNNQSTNVFGFNYVNKTAYEALLADGEDPLSEETAALYRADLFEKGNNNFDGYQFGFSGNIDEKTKAYFGAEMYEFNFDERYDAVRVGGHAIGSAGASSAGSRKVESIFGEINHDYSDATDISASARYDSYSDVGSQATFKVGAKHMVNDDVQVRASYGTSFVPPSMQQLYGAQSESYPFATDYVTCDAEGVAEEDCKSRQYATYYTSNPLLNAEDSTSMNLGVIWNIDNNQRLSADYFDITTEGAFTRVTLQALIDAERNGGAATLAQLESDTNSELNRMSSGKLSAAINTPSYLNLTNTSADLEVSGLDLKYTRVDEIWKGTLSTDVSVAHVLEYRGEEFYNGPINDKVNRYGLPDLRYIIDVNYSVNNHSVSAIYKYVTDTAEETNSSYELVGSVDDYSILDVNYNYDVTNNITLQAGMRNALDEGPVLTSDLIYDRALYLEGHMGRISYLNIEMEF